MSAHHRIETRADLPLAIARAEAVGAIGTAELFRALLAGRIAFLPPLPNIGSGEFKKFARLTARRPALALIGDDDDMHRGPSGWPIAPRALRWASTVMLHAAAAERAHYSAMIELAQVQHQALIIECSTQTLPAWLRLVSVLPHRPVTSVIVPRGGEHPIVPDRGAMH